MQKNFLIKKICKKFLQKKSYRPYQAKTKKIVPHALCMHARPQKSLFSFAIIGNKIFLSFFLKNA